MADLGVPSGAEPVAHLATPQWQSFEIRMRARKADRCLQRAAAALGDGSIAEAKAALEEARQLAPLHPRLEELTGRLDALTQPAPQALTAHGHGHVWKSAAVAAGLVVCSAAGWEAWIHREQIALLVPKANPDMDTSTGLANPTPGTVATSSSNQANSAEQIAAAAGNQSGVPTTDVSLPAASASDPASTIVQTTLVRPEQVVEAPVTPPESRSTNEPAPIATAGVGERNESKLDATKALATANTPEPTGRPQREVAPPQSPPPAPPVESRPAASLAPPSAPTPATNYIPSVVAPGPSRSTNATTGTGTNTAGDTTATSPASTAPVPSSPPAPTASAPVSASSSPPRDDRLAVRAALSRYESAYNRLDVDAVRSVWPSLDQRALARAFDGLTAQRVALQNCNVDVDGPSARASCSGSASWIPKVGGGERSAARKWTFDLRESNGAWRIVQVQAR